MLPHLSLSLRKFKYIRGSPGGMSQCVADIVSATGNFNCAHQAGIKGSYAYVYVAENSTCHICRHSREIGNRSLEHLPISQYPVYQRGKAIHNAAIPNEETYFYYWCLRYY